MIDHRGHLFDRAIEDGSLVLRCRWPECKHIWWPDETKPSKDCPFADERAGLSHDE